MNRLLGRALSLALLFVLSLPGRSNAGDPALPVVVGETHEQITAADVRSMVALAQGLVAARLQPLKVVVTATDHRKGEPPQPERATIYFAPFEADGRSWRGYCLRCDSSAIAWLDDDPTDWRKEGGWQTYVSNGIEQYIVVAPRDRALPAWSTADAADYDFASLKSELGTGPLLDLIALASGYNMSLPDGSNLALAGLKMHSVYTDDKKGKLLGHLVFSPPRSLKSHAPINVHAALQDSGEWKIVSADRYVYY